MADEYLTSGKVASAGGTGQPAVLEQVRSHAMLRLATLVKGMLDGVENILYEEAKNLPNNEQQRYMDTILEVKRRRDGMEQQFSSNMGSVFMKFGAVAKGPDKTVKLDSYDFDSLSLVNNEEMDITVTVDTLVARARMDYATPLGLLKRRYSHLLKREIDILPVDPGNVTTAFKDSCHLLDVGMMEKIVVLRVFQQGVLNEMGGLIDEINQLMIDAGVLPELKSALSGGKSGVVKSAEKAEEQKRKPADTQDVLNILQDVLTATHASGGLGGGGGDGPPGGGPVVAASAKCLPRPRRSWPWPPPRPSA